ncbi:MAG: hypothetical protein K8T89_10040 [Planctomycetes bacterium]|nr:hypothetical protein [Planctomycetota bacterium]
MILAIGRRESAADRAIFVRGHARDRQVRFLLPKLFQSCDEPIDQGEVFDRQGAIFALQGDDCLARRDVFRERLFE